jgi:branched-chain amino acid transport system permease protein
MAIGKVILNLLNGVSFGMLLFLIASGLTIVMGLMGIVNLAHGALYMVGAYVGYTVTVHYGLNFGLAVFLGGLSAGLVGLMMERGVLRRLYKRPNDQVLLTFGFVYILTNLCIWIWGGGPRLAFTAPALDGFIHLGGISYPITRIVITISGVAVAIVLWWLQDKTRFGAMVRAGMDDKEMTIGLGINLERVSMFIFFLAAFIAGIAGVIGAQLLGAYSGLSIDTLLFALIVVIVGGIGSVQGALLGAILVGVIDAFGRALFPGFSAFTMYLVMIVILMIRPQGLLKRRV